MEISRQNIEILKLFSEIISQTINDIDSFQVKYIDKEQHENELNIGKDILIIHAIGSLNECSMKDVIFATGLPNSTATRRVGELVKNKLVVRRISKNDKRKTILKLTKHGRKSFSLYFDYMTQKFEEVLNITDDNEKEILIKIFQILAKNI